MRFYGEANERKKCEYILSWLLITNFSKVILRDRFLGEVKMQKKRKQCGFLTKIIIKNFIFLVQLYYT